MPYENERANPLGHEELFRDPHLRERLKTVSTSFYSRDNIHEHPAHDLKILSREKLPEGSMAMEGIKSVVGVDGSIAKPYGIVEDPKTTPFELAAIKIAAVKQDMELFREFKNETGPRDPDLFDAIYSHTNLIGFLTGQGIIGPDSDHWSDKAREELFRSLNHMKMPSSSTTLLKVLEHITVEEDLVRACPRCLGHGRETLLSRDSFFNGIAECPDFSCGAEDIYISDPLMNTRKNIFPTQNLMLIFERLLIAGLMERANRRNSLERTLFVMDGPLSIYGFEYKFLNHWFLRHAQNLYTSPAYIGIEKTGRTAMFASSRTVQEVLKPGHIAMIPTSLAHRIKSTSLVPNKYGTDFTFGKRFLYRTEDGLKTFVFMAPPKVGPPEPLEEDDTLTESWDNYPHLRLYCDFFEETKTNRYGLNTPAVDVICEANYRASLPRVETVKLFSDLLDEVIPDL